MSMRVYISKQTFCGRDYYYFTFGSEIIYVSSDFVLFDASSPYIEFPLLNVDVVFGDNIKIVKRGLKNLFLINLHSFGGRALVEFLDKDKVEIVSKAFYTTEEDYLENKYLVLTQSTRFEFFWNNHCGNPSRGVSIYYLDGTIETLPYVSKSDFPLLFENV